MAVPKFIVFFTPFLHAVQDGKIHKAKEVQASIAQEMNLSTEDLQEMLPSGRQSTFNNRVAWARTYLDRAGLVETPARAQYRITEQEQKALSCGSIIDISYLEQFDSFQKFHKEQNDDSQTVTSDDGGQCCGVTFTYGSSGRCF